MKPVYKPDVQPLPDGGYAQAFTARFGSIQRDDGAVIVGLAEDKHEAIHGVIISFPDEEAFTVDDVYVEFNDQGNARAGTDVAVSLAGDKLMIDYSDGAEVGAGRLSYAPDADSFTDPEEPADIVIRRVVVNLELPAETLANLRREIERLARNDTRTR